MATIRGHGPQRGAFRGAIDGATVWWIAPSYPVANEIIWPDLKRALAMAWTHKNETEHYIALPGGGSVSVKSADNPDSLRGAGLDGLVFDEAAFAKKRVWTEVLRPALTDREGWAMFLTTPNGCNWFFDLFKDAGASSGWEAWQRPTRENPRIKPSELESALREIGPRAFAQEYEARFTQQEGAEFPAEYFDGIWFDEWPSEDKIRWRTMALDPSKGKTERSDYSAFAMVALDFDGTMWVDADLERRDVRQIIDDGLSLARQFKPHAFGVEANQFQEVLADLYAERSKAAGMMLPLHSIINAENKVTRIRATLTPFLARGEIRFKRHSRGAKLLVDQLRAFPVDSHDDGPDALEMAVRVTKHVFEHGLEYAQ